MLSLMRFALPLTFGMYALGGSQHAAAQTQGKPQAAASILAQVREATGGDGWEHVVELRTEGTVLFQGKTGTVPSFDNLRTGANVDRVDIPNISRKGTRLGNWLTREQAKELLAVPDRSTLKGKRDYVILALLVATR
jgi:hypothetical protein